MPQITHDNHYVPQFYLKQWSKDGQRIWGYRLLVSHENVKEWDRYAISRIAVHRDLYTEATDGTETDDFERFLASEYETPAQEALKKVRNNQTLNAEDWDKLIRLFAAQDVRTPASYVEMTERLDKILPNLLQTNLENSVQKFKKSKGQSTIKSETGSDQFFQNTFNIQVVRTPETGEAYISAEVVNDRTLWLETQRMLLKKTVKALLQHKWSIFTPATGMEWFTTDHPAVRLNYYGNGNYDLKGGWGKNGADLFMALTPYHLLYTNIGTEPPDRINLSVDKTVMIQKIMAERAFRWIFARRPMKAVIQFRPRIVDPITFKSEEDVIRNWHKEQSKAKNQE